MGKYVQAKKLVSSFVDKILPFHRLDFRRYLGFGRGHKLIYRTPTDKRVELSPLAMSSDSAF